VYLVAPEVPPDRVAALEGAFLKTMQDPEFLADAEKSKLEIAPLSGQQARKLVLETLTMPPTIKAILQPLIKLG
jgi:tripartite-type tricarboxylate transporter receptor subunit TctC